MNWRRLWPWVLLLVAVGLWFGWRAGRRQTAAVPVPTAARPAPAARPAGVVDLLQHDGAAIDFSSGRAVVKNTPADRAAVAQQVQSMDDAAKNVTFEPVAAPSAQTQSPPPAVPPPPKP